MLVILNRDNGEISLGAEFAGPRWRSVQLVSL